MRQWTHADLTADAIDELSEAVAGFDAEMITRFSGLIGVSTP
ncbi:MAG TPA: hypothetical protein VMC78_13115 [Mycobacterium sp.]|nr:hypothetical protein [Mycobacterium sp.]